MIRWRTKNTDAGILVLRLFVGLRLIYGVQDNILSWGHMKEFAAFLTHYRFPFPLLSAIVSVYAQALSGILFLLGWKVRWAALAMIFNFLAAVFMVHRGQSFEEMTAVLFMLVSALVLLFTGSGRYAIEKERSSVVFQPQEKHRNVQQQRK